LNPSKFNTELWENPVTWWVEIPFTKKVNKFLLRPGTNPSMKISKQIPFEAGEGGIP